MATLLDRKNDCGKTDDNRGARLTAAGVNAATRATEIKAANMVIAALNFMLLQLRGLRFRYIEQFSSTSISLGEDVPTDELFD